MSIEHRVAGGILRIRIEGTEELDAVLAGFDAAFAGVPDGGAVPVLVDLSASGSIGARTPLDLARAAEHYRRFDAKVRATATLVSTDAGFGQARAATTYAASDLAGPAAPPQAAFRSEVEALRWLRGFRD